MNAQTMKMPKIELKADGTWMHDGKIVTHERTCQDLFQRIYFDEGAYYLTGENIRVPVIVEEAAYFVRTLERTPDGYKIGLSNGTSEALDLTQLDLGKSGALFAKVTEKNVLAKFERKIFNEIMKDLTEREGYYGLTVGSLFYPLKQATMEVIVEAPARKAVETIKKSVNPVKLAKIKTKKPVVKKKKSVAATPVKKSAKKLVKKAVAKKVKKPVRKPVKAVKTKAKKSVKISRKKR
jgi:hypothetical protein